MRIIIGATIVSLAASLVITVPGAASASPARARTTPTLTSQTATVTTQTPATTVARSAVATAAPTATAVALPPDGSFVTAENRVWRLVGGALVYVPTWATYGGRHPTIRLTARQYEAVRLTHVRDGEFVRTIQDGRVYVVADGTPIYVSSWRAVGGVHRYVNIDVRNLLHAGEGGLWRAFNRWAMFDTTMQDPDHWPGPSYSYVPLSHFVRTLDGRVYVLTAGAPVYVSSWAPFGGPQRSVLIDGAAITRAGQPGPWRFLRWYPMDSAGWLLSAAPRPGAARSLFAVAGGAPVYVPSTLKFPEPLDPPYPVDPAAITKAGSGGPFDHLRFRPADGTFVTAWGDRDPDGIAYYSAHLYWVSRGAAVQARDDAACPVGAGRGLWIDRVAIDRAGTGGVWDHLAKVPVPAPTPPC